MTPDCFMWVVTQMLGVSSIRNKCDKECPCSDECPKP